MHIVAATDSPGQSVMAKPSRPDIPQTADTIARAKADCEAARDEARRTTGLEIGADGFARLPESRVEADLIERIRSRVYGSDGEKALDVLLHRFASQGSCLEDIEHLIDVHGLRAFLAAAMKAAAGRHIVVSFHDTDRVASLLEGDK